MTITDAREAVRAQVRITPAARFRTALATREREAADRERREREDLTQNRDTKATR